VFKSDWDKKETSDLEESRNMLCDYMETNIEPPANSVDSNFDFTRSANDFMPSSQFHRTAAVGEGAKALPLERILCRSSQQYPLTR